MGDQQSFTVQGCDARPTDCTEPIVNIFSHPGGQRCSIIFCCRSHQFHIPQTHQASKNQTSNITSLVPAEYL